MHKCGIGIEDIHDLIYGPCAVKSYMFGFSPLTQIEQMGFELRWKMSVQQMQLERLNYNIFLGLILFRR